MTIKPKIMEKLAKTEMYEISLNVFSHWMGTKIKVLNIMYKFLYPQ